MKQNMKQVNMLKSVAELWAGDDGGNTHLRLAMISSCVVVTKLWSLAVWLSQNYDL
jgi:hypothetical protein